MAASLTSQIFKGHRRGYSQVVIELSHEGFFSLFAVSVPACCELKPKIITATTTTKKSNSKCCSHASRGGGGGFMSPQLLSCQPGAVSCVTRD